jgi:hypothetical protein
MKIEIDELPEKSSELILKIKEYQELYGEAVLIKIEASEYGHVDFSVEFEDDAENEQLALINLLECQGKKIKDSLIKAHKQLNNLRRKK